MPFKPTPEQEKELEGLSSFKERENALELMALEWSLANGENPNPPDPEPEPVAPQPEPTPRVEDNPEPHSNETPVEPPVPEPAKVDASHDEAYWRKEAETWKKRKADADRALTPAQQENARLRKENEAHSSELQELKSMVQEIAKAMAAKSTVTEAVEPDPLDEFSQTYPEVAQRLARTRREVEESVKRELAEKQRELDERLHKIQEEAEAEKRRLEDERVNAYAANHAEAVKAAVPRMADYFDPNKLAPDLAAWSKTQPPLIQAVLETPLHFTPKDVAYALKLYEKSKETPEPPKKPKLGDMVQSARSNTAVAEPKEVDYYSEEEMSHIDETMRKNSHDPKKLDEIVAKYERTFAKLYS